MYEQVLLLLLYVLLLITTSLLHLMPVLQLCVAAAAMTAACALHTCARDAVYSVCFCKHTHTNHSSYVFCVVLTIAVNIGPYEHIISIIWPDIRGKILTNTYLVTVNTHYCTSSSQCRIVPHSYLVMTLRCCTVLPVLVRT
jgi:hypothetical protein